MAKDDKTEAPTPRRKSEARKKGQVARSTELPAGVGLSVAVLTAPAVLPTAADRVIEDWRWATAGATSGDPNVLMGIFGRFFFDALIALAPMVLAVAAAGIAAAITMAGPRPNIYLLKPRFEKISPKAGFKRIFSKNSLWELARTMAKLTLLGVVAYGSWTAGLEELLVTRGDFGTSLGIMVSHIWDLLVRVAILAAIIGAADAIYNKRRHLTSLKMTKNEVKDERRQSDGDPLVKGQIRARQLSMSRSRMMAEVAGASVVVTNPTHFAVALRYDPGAAAPTVVAKGADEVAKRIRDEARKWGVPVRENKPVARALFRSCQLGQTIPLELYEAVAGILAAVMRTRKVAA